MQRVFIYGTLAPGKPNEHILKQIQGTWQKANVKGKLLAEGWGAKMGCNGIVLDGSDEVNGLVFSSNELDKLWDELDTIEGKDYSRVLTDALLENGESVKTYIYELNR